MRFEDAMYEVLQTRRYDRLMGRSRDIWGAILDLIERFIDWLLGRVNLSFPEGTGDSRLVPIIFAIVGGILLAVGLFVLARVLWRAHQRKTYNLSDIFEELTANNYTVADLMKLSDDATDQRVAIRYRYIAALLALDGARVIRINPSMTNALILRGLKQDYTTLAEPFYILAHTYHLAWFGYRSIDETEFAQFCTACNALTEAKDA
ncbi:MAG: DUF4129 domain-containing protein [Defluviitaleaceae bacterium]|nr:DUF4129 domain-containing protein [Defluviitaleaceae bacterium]